MSPGGRWQRPWLILAAIGVVGLVGVSAASIPAVRDQFFPPLRRGLVAYEAGEWSRAEGLARRHLMYSPGDPTASRLLARSLARAGMTRDAVEHFRTLGPAGWDAEDLVLLGKSLFAEGQIVLGWAAVDAASKLDPKNREVNAVLTNFAQSSQNQRDATGLVNLITAVSEGKALAELVAGLLSISGVGTSPGQNEPNLVQLLQRDRSTFSALRTPDDARKLLARMELESGRPREARIRLEGVSNRSTDPETNWLLSRCCLLLDESDRASEYVEKAGAFGKDRPLAHEPGVYSGAKSCAECHGAIYQSQQNGPHGQTVAWGDGLKRVPLPPGELADPYSPEVKHRFERDGSRIKVESRVRGQSIEAVIAYALGSGRHGVTMLGRDREGTYRSLRMSYYSKGGHWDLTSGFPPLPVDPNDYLGMALSPSAFTSCLNCHTTRFTSERDRSGPEAQDRGIGCEKCHGPGANHLRSVAEGFPQLAIARPRIATPAQRIALCGQCHGSDGKIPPSDPRFVRFQATTFPYSRCVSESAGKLDCVACHDPHRGVDTNMGHYEKRCLACHGGGAPDPALRLSPVAAAGCKVNPREGCVDCHMPRAKDVLPFTSFTDHHIRIHRPSGAGAAGPAVASEEPAHGGE